MSAPLARPGLGATTPPAAPPGAATDALAQLATLRGILTSSGLTAAQVQAATQALDAATADVNALAAAQMPPGAWVSAGFAGAAVGIVGLLAGGGGYLFGKKKGENR